jgi:Flp pilus assembly pilin Flp
VSIYGSAYAQEGHPVSLLSIKSQLDTIRDYVSNEDAQGITEYGAVLCFVSLLVALAFTFTNGSLGNAVQLAFSAVTSQLNNMSNAAASSS